MGLNFRIFILQLITMIILFVITYFAIKISRTFKLEKKISLYSIDSIDYEEVSILDKIKIFYSKNLKKISKLLNKSAILRKRCKRYNKYINFSDEKRLNPIDYTSIKFLITVALFLIVILFDIFQLKRIGIAQVIIIVLFGYFGLDIYMFFNMKIRKKVLNEDLLKAIIIMNSAFKSGRTTMQAVEIVKNELSGPIGEEFSKIYTDLSFGLSIDETFRRFASRVDNDDAKYIASSLTVLNKTGGDIVKVFSSIEKSFFTRRKLTNELKSLTSSANLMFRVLLCAPIIIFLIIFMLNPSYFVPLVNTTIGLITLGLIMLIYISYIVVIKKVMKIEI